jgi:ribosome-associated toxin RatA of RatAB toxin-antitoxin module
LDIINTASVIIQKMKMANIFIFGFFASSALFASPLAFPDSVGKIVDRTQEYVIRLVETPTSDIKTAEALFLVKGSPRACLTVISDFEHYPEFMPNIRSADFVEKKDSRTIYRFSFRVALWTVRYSNVFWLQSLENGAFVLNWDYVDGDLKKTSGSWDIRPCRDRAGHSIIRYRVFLDTGMFVPRWVCDLLTAKSIPKMIKAIAERAGTESSQ